MRSIAVGFFALAMTAASFAVSEARTYTVATGDTIATVAQVTNTSPAVIARRNQLESDLRPGTVLELDDASTAPSTPALTAEMRRRIAAAEAALVPSEEGTDLAMWSGSEAKATPAGSGMNASKQPASGGLRKLADRIVNRTSSIAVNLTRNAMRFIGTPYSFGGTTARGFDCSGYVQHVFALLGVHLARTADVQYANGARVAAVEPGDLVFFQTYAAGASHVGIYIGNGNFIHSSSSHGVTISALRDSYWSARYLGAKRVVASK